MKKIILIFLSCFCITNSFAQNNLWTASEISHQYMNDSTYRILLKIFSNCKLDYPVNWINPNSIVGLCNSDTISNFNISNFAGVPQYIISNLPDG